MSGAVHNEMVGRLGQGRLVSLGNSADEPNSSPSGACRSSTEGGKTPLVGLSPHIVLIGLPGSGKTTVGRHLANVLERPFIDFDEAIEHRLGKSVSRIFTEHGEPAFRAAEATLSKELATQPSHVLSPGGGWIANREAMAHLRPRSRIIYLRVSPAGALQRLGEGVTSRPLFANGDPTETMQLLYDARRGFYEEAADLTIETDFLGRDALLTKAAELVSSAWDLNSDV